MIFTNDKGQEYRYEQEGLNIWRNSFDNWLVEKAMQAGSEVRDGTSVLSCEEKEDCVIVSLKDTLEYTEKAKIVISCDGAVSTIKRQLLKTPNNYITTFQTFNKGTIDLDYHYFYAYLQPQLSEYDAWFNVKDDYLIFGVSVKDTSKIQHFYSEFLSYMALHHNAIIEKKVKEEKWIMPHIMQGCPVDYGKGRILFAGETAGFLNPMGEGISAGMESGNAAAQAIQQVDLYSTDWDIQTVHSAYKHNTEVLRNYMIRQWQFVASMSSTFEYMK
jgi:flavin-dependent dehydrogenase